MSGIMLPSSASPPEFQILDVLPQRNRIRPIALDVVSPLPGPSTSGTGRPSRLHVPGANDECTDDLNMFSHIPDARSQYRNLVMVHDMNQRFQFSPDARSRRNRPQALELGFNAISRAATPQNIADTPACGPSTLPGESSSQGPGCCTNLHNGWRTKKSNLVNWFVAKARGLLHPSRSPSIVSTKGLKEEVELFLDENQGFLQEYLMNKIPLDVFESLYFVKIELDMNKTDPVDNRDTMNTLKTIGQKEFMGILKQLSKKPSEWNILWELAISICSVIQGVAFRVYKIFPGSLQDIVEVFTMNENDGSIVLATIRPHIQILEAVRLARCVMATRINEPLKLNPGARSVFKDKECNLDNVRHAIAVPIINDIGEVSHVIEIWRAFWYHSDDVDVASTFMVWGSLAIHYCNMLTDKKKESELTCFLLRTVKAIFEELISLDQVIKRILKYAQKLVHADRASLFLVDHKNKELVSTVFDLKLNDQDSKDNKEIRMPITRGIAGHVVTTGKYVNIPDAYSDYRFNRITDALQCQKGYVLVDVDVTYVFVDEATGYRTTSILCMPININGKIIGVVQMVNKKTAKNFCTQDEITFNIFASFFGIALHHARLYDKITRKEQKYRVALEVLSYHNTCRDTEVEKLVLLEPHSVPFLLSDFYLDPFALNVVQKCQAVMIMINDLFDMKNFDHLNVTRFVLTVKKNYRDVPYHNFHHGWSVAQTMYAILKKDTSQHFSYKQRLALFVASLCHDLDHRGYTNKYMSETASPLAAMYTTSALEHHHFNITVTILQQDGHNIFSRFSSEEYKDILGLIRTCILATDLAAFFPNLVQMMQLCRTRTDEGLYNWKDQRHSELAMVMSMTAADLSASAKPWDIQNKTVKVIFEEFYDQGDKERAAGRNPIPMMDRNKPQEQPASQVGFLNQICLPCYEMMQNILPNTSILFEMASKNLEMWSQKAKEVEQLKTENINLGTEKSAGESQMNKDVSSVDSPSPDQ